ncbi:MAG: alkyl sulfatase C-terminal domain-containing protein [Actinocatenispora sp.]
MATIEECRQALDTLSERMVAHAAQLRGKVALDRRLVCRLPDLGTAFHGRLNDGAITDIELGDDPQARITLQLTSDDLVALVAGELDFARSWATGRLSVKASVLDLVKLRKLL